MKHVIVPLAPGFEEIEALTVVDILRRGGIDVTVAGTVDGPITGRSKITVIADVSLDAIDPDHFDMVVLPGGQPGTNNLKKDSRVAAIIKSLNDKNKTIAAICAAPSILSAIGLLDGKNVTSFPGIRDDLKETQYSEERVVVDGNIITSRSAGTAMEFALKLVEILRGKTIMNSVSHEVLAKS